MKKQKNISGWGGESPFQPEVCRFSGLKGSQYAKRIFEIFFNNLFCSSVGK